VDTGADRAADAAVPAGTAIAHTRAWVERAVIGLNLCPFAKAPQVKGQVRYVASAAVDVEALLHDLIDELQRLADAADTDIETTLLIHPHVLGDFADFNDFLDLADRAVLELGLEGVLQVASFHPQYQFADSAPEDLGNATNRSPYPTLHLLREESIDRAVASFPQAETIFEANIATMRELGAQGWALLQRRCREDAAATADAAVAGAQPAGGGTT
jgi:hypothetical protein